MRVWNFSALSLVVTLGLSSCGDDYAAEPVGEAQIALTEVPAGVACIRISAAGSRVVRQSFMPGFVGQTTVYVMTGLPLGDVLFSGEAFDVPCGAIGGAIPTWTGGPVAAEITATAITPVTVVMKRNGRARVGVDFDDLMCTIQGEACTTSSMCCGGPNLTSSCTAGACAATCNGGTADCNANIPLDGCETLTFDNINNCGGCGIVCPFGCSGTFCINTTLSVGGNTYQGIRMIGGSPTTSPAGITAPIVFGGLCDVPDPAWAGQIVLCQRGLITFQLKTDNVQSQGGLAAAVFNNIAVPPNLVGTIGPVGIPVAGFTQADGLFIVANNLGQTATLISLP